MKSVSISALLLLAACSAAHADNLLVNGNFDINADAWVAGEGSALSWLSQDADGAANSGSLGLATANGQTSSLVASQCIAVSGGDFSFGARILPAAFMPAGFYGMDCAAYTAADCSGQLLDLATAVAGEADANGWVPFRTSAPFTLPPTTLGVSCEFVASQPLRPAGAKQPSGFSNAINADDAFFSPGTTPVSLQSFDVR